LPIDRPNLLALNASLLPEQEALAAWNQLKEAFTIDDIQPELLPLIFSNLSSHLAGDNLLGKLKGCHHFQWSKNQVLLYQLAERLRLLNQAGIEVLLIGDAPVASRYYSNSGDRSLGQFEVFVPSEQMREAVSLLDSKTRAIRQAANKHDFSLSLRSNILLGPGRDQQFWLHRSKIEILDCKVCVLDPVDQLFYSLLAFGRKAAAMWITDVLMVASFAELDLNTVAQRAQRYRVAARLKAKINFLYSSQFQPQPCVQALKRISGLSADAWEVVEHCLPGLGAFGSAFLRFAERR